MLSDLKLMLGIDGEDKRLELIVANARAQLKIRLGGLEPPVSLDYIVMGVSISRYNKIGSEGLTSHTVEGESLTFAASDFDEYADDIAAYLETQKESAKGRVRFL
jgi:hypothetical protein